MSFSGLTVEKIFDARCFRHCVREFRIDDLDSFSSFLKTFFTGVGNCQTLFVEVDRVFKSGFRIFDMTGNIFQTYDEILD